LEQKLPSNGSVETFRQLTDAKLLDPWNQLLGDEPLECVDRTHS
jgi:hypothetical protein